MAEYVGANTAFLIAAKGNFINDNNLAGFAVWHVGGDFNDILLDAISDAIGIADQDCS